MTKPRLMTFSDHHPIISTVSRQLADLITMRFPADRSADESMFALHEIVLGFENHLRALQTMAQTSLQLFATAKQLRAVGKPAPWSQNLKNFAELAGVTDLDECSMQAWYEACSALLNKQRNEWLSAALAQLLATGTCLVQLTMPCQEELAAEST